MRSALTIIELIFVIIILAVLSAVALPKLASTREDAKIAVLSSQIQLSLSEITNTYASTAVMKRPEQMSRVLFQMYREGIAKTTSDAPISGSLGQLSILSQDGVGGYDTPFILDLNQTILVLRYGTPCVGVICQTLQRRIAEGNFTIGGSGIVF